MSARRLVSAIFILVVTLPRLASTAGLIVDGPAFPVNTVTNEDQQAALARAVSRAPDGTFVVVWDSYRQPSTTGYSVQARRYSSTGVPTTLIEFQVNTFQGNYQVGPAVATAGDGGFVVVWSSQYNSGDDSFGVFGQRYDGSGATVGTEFHVNDYTPEAQGFDWGSPRRALSVAAAADGSFVVVYESEYGLDGDGNTIHGRRFDSTGTPGAEFVVNKGATGHQRHPSVSMTADGDFVAVWDGPDDGDARGIFGRRFDATGAPVSGDFVINTVNTGYQEFPAVDCAADGSFLVTWNSVGQVRGRRYDAAGVPPNPEITIGSGVTSVGQPAVAADADGKFLVVWESPEGEIVGRMVDNQGALVGSQLQINTYTTGSQSFPSVSTDGAGHFVAVWNSRNEDGSREGVFGRRLCWDADGDALCDESEYVSQPVTGGDEVNTDPENDGATPDDPIETSVKTSAAGAAGTVTIQESVVSTAPPVLEVTISAPDGTVSDPLVLKFLVDSSIAANFTILKNGIAVTELCNSPTAADPSPCIAGSDVVLGGDMLVTVNTVTASLWRLEGSIVVSTTSTSTLPSSSTSTSTSTPTSTSTSTTLPFGCGVTPAGGCLGGVKASFQLKTGTEPTKHLLKWKLTKGQAFDYASLGDPVTARAYLLCVYDATAGVPALAGTVRIDPNAGWIAKDPKGYFYKDKLGTEDGVLKVSLKAGLEGKTSVNLIAKGPNLPLPSPLSGTEYLNMDTTVTVQLVNDETAQCWTTAFTIASKNDGIQFKAKAP